MSKKRITDVQSNNLEVFIRAMEFQQTKFPPKQSLVMNYDETRVCIGFDHAAFFPQLYKKVQTSLISVLSPFALCCRLFQQTGPSFLSFTSLQTKQRQTKTSQMFELLMTSKVTG